jgi:hypothetical protein
MDANTQLKTFCDVQTFMYVCMYVRTKFHAYECRVEVAETNRRCQLLQGLSKLKACLREHRILAAGRHATHFWLILDVTLVIRHRMKRVFIVSVNRPYVHISEIARVRAGTVWCSFRQGFEPTTFSNALHLGCSAHLTILLNYICIDFSTKPCEGYLYCDYVPKAFERF